MVAQKDVPGFSGKEVPDANTRAAFGEYLKLVLPKPCAHGLGHQACARCGETGRVPGPRSFSRMPGHLR